MAALGAILATTLQRLILLLTLILRIALWPVARVSKIIFPPNEHDGITNNRACDGAARQFSDRYQKIYLSARRGRPPSSSGTDTLGGGSGHDNGDVNRNNGELHNPFEAVGYKKCLSDASRRNKCLLVYLHSPLHRDTDAFCREVLSNPSLLRFLHSSRDSLMAWGGSIHAADGANVAKLLSVSRFPFIALLGCQRGRNSAEILLKLEGRISSDELLARLTLAVERHRAVLEERELRRLQREEEVRLRQEQDREYQETLAADREREERARREEEERLEAERAAEEAELRAVEERRRALDDARASLPPEPSATGHAPGSTTRIRFTLPNGRRVDRRFKSEDTIGVVRAFLILHFEENAVDITNFSISTNYPKRTFDLDSERGLSLVEAGLVPQAVIMIQNLDA